MQHGFALGIQQSNEYGFNAEQYHPKTLDPLFGGFVKRLNDIGVREGVIDILLEDIGQKAESLGITITPQILAPGFGVDTDEALASFVRTGEKTPGSKAVSDTNNYREQAVVDRFRTAIFSYLRFLSGKPASPQESRTEIDNAQTSLVPLAETGMNAPISTQEVSFFTEWIKNEIRKIITIGNMDVRDICEEAIMALEEEVEDCVDEIANIISVVQDFFIDMHHHLLGSDSESDSSSPTLLLEGTTTPHGEGDDVDSVQQFPKTKFGPTLPRRILTGLYVRLVALFTQLQALLLGKRG